MIEQTAGLLNKTSCLWCSITQYKQKQIVRKYTKLATSKAYESSLNK